MGGTGGASDAIHSVVVQAVANLGCAVMPAAPPVLASADLNDAIVIVCDDSKGHSRRQTRGRFAQRAGKVTRLLQLWK